MPDKHISPMEISEVDVEVGFILGCTCSSLELEDDENTEDADDASSDDAIDSETVRDSTRT